MREAGRPLTKKVFGRELTPEQAVDRIVEDVRKKGDSALFSYTRKLDGFVANPKNIRVTKSEIQQALNHLECPLEVAIRAAIRNVRFFHTKGKAIPLVSQRSANVLGPALDALG